MCAGRPEIEFAYLIEGLPQDRAFHFAVELNFAGIPIGTEDRFFYQADRRLGGLETPLDLADVQHLGIRDHWLGLDIQMNFDRAGGLWTFPIGTVSQSEGGFEWVHQSVVVQPHWIIRGDSLGRWSLKIRMALECGVAAISPQASSAVEDSQPRLPA